MKHIQLHALWLVLLLSAGSAGQDGIGIPSMKIEPAARQAGMAGVAAGIGDDANALFWNPGAIGHLRRWQWSATYNRWFADLTQASFTASKLFNALGSGKTGIGVTCNYIGMPSWDATGGRAEAVSANDFFIGIGIGQRLDWLHKSLSIGGHVKSIQSRMDRYSATGFAADFGILFKPGRFRLGGLGFGIFDYGIITLGASLSHVGGKLTFDTEGTLLPQTWRAGASLRVGRYAGWTWLVASDLIGVRGRGQVTGVGGEVWWKEILALRLGYRSNGRDLGDFSFGFGFRWDDVLNGLLGLPSRFGDAFQADLADVSYGEALQQAYRGELSHFPSAPEPFTLHDPHEATSDSAGVAAIVNLDWQTAEDPDPFDDVQYLVIVDRRRTTVEDAVKQLETDWDGFWDSSSRYLSIRDSLLFFKDTPHNRCVLPVATGGNYYWAVAAYDKGHHVRMAKKGGQKVLRFLVAVPDLIVRSVSFSPSPFITMTPEQGRLSIEISNEGSAGSMAFNVLVQDFPSAGAGLTSDTVYAGGVQAVPLNRSVTFTVPWKTAVPGGHTIRVTADPDSNLLELIENNNSAEFEFVTIPKGRLEVPDSVEVMVTGYSNLEVPLVPEIYFETNSGDVPESYSSSDGIFPALLPTLAKRLTDNPDIMLRVYGSIDALSGEKEVSLADVRAENVRNGLERLGVSGSRVEVVQNHPARILGRRPMPKNPQDAEWVMQQNRVVSFGVDQKYEETLFQPYQFAVDTTMRDSVKFDSRIHSPSGIQNWELSGQTGALELDSRRAVDGDSLWGDLIWKGTDRNKVVVQRNRWYRYSLLLTDALGRTFRTPNDSIFLQEKRTIQRQEIFGAAKFAKVEPVYAFYWDRVMSTAEEMIQYPDMRLRFEGHACAIGPDRINERLSFQRASDFTRKFLERVKARFPEQYENIRSRISEPVGLGNREPLVIQLKGMGQVLLGDNRTPTGRYLNRRIAVLLYREN